MSSSELQEIRWNGLWDIKQRKNQNGRRKSSLTSNFTKISVTVYDLHKGSFMTLCKAGFIIGQ
jgi:hypothetical protein